MARRSRGSQTKHDRRVAQKAKELERKGWDVNADVSGFTQPGTIGGVRPDIDARKGRRRQIIEVETTESVDSARDRAQQREFQKAARRSPNTTFKREVVD